MELVKNNSKVGFDTMNVFFISFFATSRTNVFLKITTHMYIIFEHFLAFERFFTNLEKALARGSMKLSPHMLVIFWFKKIIPNFSPSPRTGKIFTSIG